MNSGAGLIGADPTHAAEVISGWGFAADAGHPHAGRA